jgi:hypothetical protein
MTNEITDTDYRFKDAPLTPAVVEFLALELFPGKLVERHVLEEEVVRAHVSRGGKQPPPEAVGRSSKKGLSSLKGKGLVENPVLGHWRFPSASQPSATPPSATLDSTETESPIGSKETSIVQEDLPEAIADRVLGIGPAAVYLYYLPVYRLRAEEHSQKFWPCKIGRTDRDPVARILAQAATALPESPHVALVIRTSFALAWEAALHGVLTLRGRQIEDIPGAEWFLTSPDEVYSLAMSFDPSLNQSEGAQLAPAQFVA